MSTEHNRANKTCKMMEMYISVFVVFFFFFFEDDCWKAGYSYKVSYYSFSEH